MVPSLAVELCGIWGVKEMGAGQGCNICFRGTQGSCLCIWPCVSRLGWGRSPLDTASPVASSRVPCSTRLLLSVRLVWLLRRVGPQKHSCSPLAHPGTLHPATITFMFLAQAQAAHAAVHRYKWKQKRPCTKNTQALQQPCRLCLCKHKFARVVQPTCFSASALPLCFQRFEATAALLLSLPFPNSLLSNFHPCFCHSVSFLTCCFTKDGMLKKDVCVFPVSPIPPHRSLPVPLTLLSQHSAHWLSTKRRCQSSFTPAASGEWGGRRGGGGCLQERSSSWHWCWHLAYGAPSLKELDPLCISPLHCSEIIFPVP